MKVAAICFKILQLLNKQINALNIHKYVDGIAELIVPYEYHAVNLSMNSTAKIARKPKESDV